MTRILTALFAFILGFVPGAGYAYLGQWRLAAANFLTFNWFVFGFFLITPVHCAYLAVRGEGE